MGFHRFLDTHRPRVMGRAVRLSALTREGLEVEIELTLSNLQADGEELLIGSLRDLSERVQLERQTTLAHYLKVTAQTASRLGGLAELDSILETVVGTLAEDLGAALAQTWLVDPADGLLTLRARLENRRPRPNRFASIRKRKTAWWAGPPISES